tara:strand:- start:320 stop:646 length:327 start_codon:yes stop_codon:yes gene_type:complete
LIFTTIKEIINMEKAKEEHIFESMDEFFQLLNNHSLQHLHPVLMDFHETFSNINKGCGCAKKKRIRIAKDTYANIKNIDPGIALEFKRKFVAKKIILKHEGVVYSYME